MPGRKRATGPVNIHDAKTRLSQLIERVEAGEEIVIARAGRPVARLSPLRAHLGPRRLGRLDGQMRIPDDFNAPLPDRVLRRFQRGR
jgi:prevent-host-death family protein